MLLVSMFSCGRSELKSYSDSNELVEAALKNANVISPADFKAVMESDASYYLIDCRESEEFDLACIKGALSVPRGVLEDEIANQAPKKRTPVYIYCSNGQRSALAAQVLPLLKYSSVYLIEGGFDAWQQTYPELVENAPVRGTVKKAVAAPSGGCGG
jgi:rhodanese-related sulfurtransferase